MVIQFPALNSPHLLISRYMHADKLGVELISHPCKHCGKEFKLKWSIKSQAPTYTSGSRKCQLCLKEKTAIAMADPKKLLNNRTELLHKCLHLTNFELRKVKIPP